MARVGPKSRRAQLKLGSCFGPSGYGTAAGEDLDVGYTETTERRSIWVFHELYYGVCFRTLIILTVSSWNIPRGLRGGGSLRAPPFYLI